MRFHLALLGVQCGNGVLSMGQLVPSGRELLIDGRQLHPDGLGPIPGGHGLVLGFGPVLLQRLQLFLGRRYFRLNAAKLCLGRYQRPRRLGSPTLHHWQCIVDQARYYHVDIIGNGNGGGTSGVGGEVVVAVVDIAAISTSQGGKYLIQRPPDPLGRGGQLGLHLIPAPLGRFDLSLQLLKSMGQRPDLFLLIRPVGVGFLQLGLEGGDLVGQVAFPVAASCRG
mmetsp:Transcript_24752/g.71489  ORF Transcript_24752/g.71489 Transcript_24752/m.71489 type:complete len:224 (-) Transcript_24752:1016-1687(-)